MKIQCKIFHESRKIASAQNSILKMLNQNDSELKILSTELYLDKGCVSCCEEDVGAETWADFVYEVIGRSQQIVRKIEVFGNISEEIDFVSTEIIAGSGIKLATWYCSRNDFRQKR